MVMVSCTNSRALSCDVRRVALEVLTNHKSLIPDPRASLPSLGYDMFLNGDDDDVLAIVTALADEHPAIGCEHTQRNGRDVIRIQVGEAQCFIRTL